MLRGGVKGGGGGTMNSVTKSLTLRLRESTRGSDEAHGLPTTQKGVCGIEHAPGGGVVGSGGAGCFGHGLGEDAARSLGGKLTN